MSLQLEMLVCCFTCADNTTGPDRNGISAPSTQTLPQGDGPEAVVVREVVCKSCIGCGGLV